MINVCFLLASFLVDCAKVKRIIAPAVNFPYELPALIPELFMGEGTRRKV